MARVLVFALASVLVATTLGSCREPDRTVVAFLLAADTAPRWQEFDEPSFRARVEARCPDCDYLTHTAGGDAETQADQFAEVVAEGADVVVLNAVTSDLGEELVAKAGSTPVLAYDRFVAGADYYVAYDADQIGSRLARAVVRQVGGAGSVLLVNGAQTDANGVAVKAAVHRVLDRSDLEILAELDPVTWAGEEAAAWVEGQLVEHPGVDAIVAANDSQAAGVVQALTEAEVQPSDWPIVTGQDAELAALRRIITGEQTLTVLKSFPREAEQAADTAINLATGGTVEGAEPFEGVPAFVFAPIVVTLDNLTDTVVRDGIYSTGVLCAGSVRARCEELGII